MNGPEHYRKAEECIAALPRVVNQGVEGRLDPRSLADTVAVTLAQAQVHATLALAAATASDRMTEHPSDDRLLHDEISTEREAWLEVLR